MKWIDQVRRNYSEIPILCHEFQVHIVASHSGVVLVSWIYLSGLIAVPVMLGDQNPCIF